MNPFENPTPWIATYEEAPTPGWSIEDDNGSVMFFIESRYVKVETVNMLLRAVNGTSKGVS
jgi:hypothetical protein